MENPTLPEEIVVEIFSRLPTKSVGRCRTLSKSWETNLSTNHFIKKHLINRQQITHQQNSALVKVREPVKNDKLYIVISPTKNDEVFSEQSFPGDEWYAVSGSCNGLILLTGYRGMLLVNPITCKHVTVNKAPIRRQDLGRFSSIIHGFGYDSLTDDYKIVRLTSFSPKNISSDFTTLVDVYYVKTGVWKRVDDYPSRLVPERYANEGGAFVNGAVHWFMARSGTISSIAAFDLANEVFYEIPMPTGFDREPRFFDGRTNGLAVVGGCLSIVDNYGNGATDIWILKEYGVAESWVRFHGPWPSIGATLCFVEDGELLCVTKYGYLFACDLKGGSAKNVILGGCDNRFSHGMAFVDSLVSPE